MRILFVMRHSGFVRNFEPALEELLRRGHDVYLAFERPRAQAETAERIAERHHGLTSGHAPIRSDRWVATAFAIRGAIDGLRYRSHLYDGAAKLRARGMRGLPTWLRWITAPAPMRHDRVLGALTRALARLDAALPAAPAITEFLVERRPDRVLVTPLVDGPTQSDWVQAARRRGIPTALAVASWDNLTNKGRIHVTLDQVLVWNESQLREVTELHGVARERVVVTGAHSYDHWFGWPRHRDRAQLCAAAGLPADPPLLLYLCSSPFIAPEEPVFVRRWLTALRAGPEPLRAAAVMVRPHPANGAVWDDVDLRELGPVAVWPPGGADPRNPQAKADYFDSMHACDAAIAVNTSAVVELAIVGRQCFTVLAPEFRETQNGTLHFAYLTGTAGGALSVAADLPQHFGQLAAAVNGDRRAPNEGFVRAFVRPYGLEEAGAPRFAEAIEALTLTAPTPGRTLVDAVFCAALAPVPHLLAKRGKWRARWRRSVRRWRLRKRATRTLRRARVIAGRLLGRP